MYDNWSLSCRVWGDSIYDSSILSEVECSLYVGTYSAVYIDPSTNDAGAQQRRVVENC